MLFRFPVKWILLDALKTFDETGVTQVVVLNKAFLGIGNSD